MQKSPRVETEGKLQMLLSHRHKGPVVKVAVGVSGRLSGSAVESFSAFSQRALHSNLPSNLGPKNQRKLFFVQSFSTTLRVMDVRAENRRRPPPKVGFPAAPVMGRNFLTPGNPGVRVRNVRGKSGPKSLCYYVVFSSLIPTWYQVHF